MRERIYYEINEQSARSAHEMMSFRDYKEGSLTAEYKGYVDEAYVLADKVAEQLETRKTKATTLQKENISEYFEGETDAFEFAIKIVKGGGVE